MSRRISKASGQTFFLSQFMKSSSYLPFFLHDTILFICWLCCLIAPRSCSTSGTKWNSRGINWV